MTTLSRRTTLAATAAAAMALPRPGRAREVAELRIAQQFGLVYLPLIVLQNQPDLLRAAADRQKIPAPKLSFVQLSGGAATNDALLSGSIEVAAAGIPPVVTLWSRSRGQVRAIAALAGLPFWLTVRNPNVQTIADFTSADRIAVPAVRVSFQSVVLAMAAEKVFGAGQHDRLEPLTVGLPHPDATAQMLADRGEITAHFGNPPFQNVQVAAPHIRKLLSSFEVLGGAHTSVLAYATQRFRDANPKTVAALIDALDQANAWITANPAEAAALYQRSERTGLSAAAVEGLIRDPETEFSTTPRNIVAFAQFLARTGRIPAAPASWQDLVFSDLAGRAGS
jgi:NitT/TauT family transport system substrate-binding protein